jgi:hypothetical protein
MRTSFATVAALLAACARAIEITNPTKGQVVDLSAGFKITWSTVSSDPASAHLFLVNMAGGHTPYSKDLGTVDLTKGSFTITESDVPSDTTYQFNIQSISTQNTGILAQSPQFEVKSSGKKTSTTATTTKSDDESSTSVASESAATGSASVSVESGKSTLATSTTAAATASGTGAAKTSAAASASSKAAAPANKAIQGGSMLALVAGLAAVLA